MSQSETTSRLTLELAAKQRTIDLLLLGFQSPPFPVVEGLSFDVLYKPAATMERLGGDWYDVFSLPDGRTAFTIGDVCGRGLAAAVKMGQAKQAVKVAAFLQTNDPRPLAVLDQTNKVIFLNDHEVEFTTAIYGLIDTVTRTVTYACAGHHPPILAMAGEPARVMPNHGFPLGVEVNLPDLIREHSFVYEPGTLLVLYTDGLIESNHDADEGEAQLLKASRDAVETKAPNPARFIVENVLEESSVYYYPNVGGNYTVTGNPNTFDLSYKVVRYQAGATIAPLGQPFFLDAGFMGDKSVGKTNAPGGYNHQGPFVGLGLRF